MSPPGESASPSPWHALAAVAGWLLPGLGHLLIGEKQRGIVLLVAIGCLWLGGTLIGGVSVFDYKNHRMWFLGQMLVAPSVAVAYFHDALVIRHGDPRPSDNPPAFSPAYGRTQEQGLLYTCLAGMLNLLTIIDVLYRDPKKVRRRDLLDAEPAPEP